MRVLEERYLKFKVVTPPRQKITQADVAERIRAQVKEVSPKAIEELNRQFENAKTPKRRAKLEARIENWLKLYGTVFKEEMAMELERKQKESLTGEEKKE